VLLFPLGDKIIEVLNGWHLKQEGDNEEWVNAGGVGAIMQRASKRVFAAKKVAFSQLTGSVRLTANTKYKTDGTLKATLKLATSGEAICLIFL